MKVQLNRQVSVFLIFLITVATPIVGLADDLNSRGWKVVNYWSKTCAPCRIEIPEFNRLSQTLAPHDIAVLGINFDEDKRDTTLEIAALMGIKFPTLTNQEAKGLRLPFPSVMPTTYILSPNGNVASTLVGAQDQDSILSEFSNLGLVLEDAVQ